MTGHLLSEDVEADISVVVVSVWGATGLGSGGGCVFVRIICQAPTGMGKRFGLRKTFVSPARGVAEDEIAHPHGHKPDPTHHPSNIRPRSHTSHRSIAVHRGSYGVIKCTKKLELSYTSMWWERQGREWTFNTEKRETRGVA